MEKSDPRYQAYIQILKEELIPAMGCTEPIALAYAGAVAKKALGEQPDKVKVEASGSIIKNVKSVIVPNTGHLKGINAAVTAGIVAGDPDKQLEVIAQVSSEQIQQMKQFMKEVPVEIEHLAGGCTFDIIVTVYHGESYAKVRIANYHTNIVLIEKNGEVLRSEAVSDDSEDGLTDRTLLDMEHIWDFATTVDINDVKELLDQQIACNVAIAEEGLKNDYGANIGKVLLDMGGDDVRVRAKAMAAAGSDARMNGCALPVAIVCGSGNQGITCALPVMEYAEYLRCDHERLVRAVMLSDLIAVHIKSYIGALSAFCGAICAACGAGAAITWLCGGTREQIGATVSNTLGNVGGIVCDGAKASCAAKISAAVDAAILGHDMAMQGRGFRAGEGLIQDTVEQTIASMGYVGRVGMKDTDVEILNIMIGKTQVC